MSTDASRHLPGGGSDDQYDGSVPEIAGALLFDCDGEAGFD